MSRRSRRPNPVPSGPVSVRRSDRLSSRPAGAACSPARCARRWSLWRRRWCWSLVRARWARSFSVRLSVHTRRSTATPDAGTAVATTGMTVPVMSALRVLTSVGTARFRWRPQRPSSHPQRRPWSFPRLPLRTDPQGPLSGRLGCGFLKWKPSAPTSAEYIPGVAEAVSPGTRRVYGSYWNRLLEHWGERLDEPSPSDIEQPGAEGREASAAREHPPGRAGWSAGGDQ
jgi:hypothetical protein